MSGEVIKFIAVIVVSAVFITALRTRLAEQGFLLAVVVIVIVLLAVGGSLSGAVLKFKDLFGKVENANLYFLTALKVLGISYIVTFAADLCRDFGMSALAQTAEITGKIAIFVLSLPLVTDVLDTALKFVGL